MATITKQNCIDAVKQVVVDILTDFGLPCSNIGPSTVPHKIEQFDSDIGIFGTVAVMGATGINIPLDENIFCDKKGDKMRSIEGAAERLMELQAEQLRSKRSPNGEVGVAS
jgi:hypothetical protein